MSEKSAVKKCIELAAMSPHKAITGIVVPNARQELAELRVEGWVAVSDSLPPLEEPVWLYFSGHAPFIGCRTDDVDGWLWANCYDDCYFDAGKWKTGTAEVDDDYQPTHWQRLPLPPRGEE